MDGADTYMNYSDICGEAKLDHRPVIPFTRPRLKNASICDLKLASN
jgi:hypothetical protein